MRPETPSSPTHDGDLSVPCPGKAERREAAQCQLRPRQRPRVSFALEPRVGQAASAFPCCQKPFPASAFQTKPREVPGGDEKLIALMSTILGPNPLGQIQACQSGWLPKGLGLVVRMTTKQHARSHFTTQCSLYRQQKWGSEH